VQKRASILVGLLWCLALLALVVVGVLHTARMDLLTGKNFSDKIQAHYLALAGIEKAKALLYKNASERSRSGKNHTGEFYDNAQQFREVEFGRGTYSVIRRGRQDDCLPSLLCCCLRCRQAPAQPCRQLSPLRPPGQSVSHAAVTT